MNNRAFTISFIVALVAVAMIYSYVSSTEDTLKQSYGAEKTVVVAKTDIRELDLLNETNLTLQSVPDKYVQPGVAPTIDDLKGSLAIAPILKGEQVTRTKVTQLGARTGLSRQVAPGKRAVTVMVTEDKGVSHLIKPGDRVDILARIEMQPGHKEKTEVRTVLQDVLVLATGKYIANTIPGILEADPLNKNGKRTTVNLTEYNTYSNITIEVDPVQAQQIIFIESTLDGVYLTLRNNDDNMKEDMGNATFADVLGATNASGSRQAAAPQERQQAQLQQQPLLGRQGDPNIPNLAPVVGGKR